MRLRASRDEDVQAGVARGHRVSFQSEGGASVQNQRELAAISTRRAVWSCLAHDLYISDQG
jgi:hypothetical protein